MRSLAIELHFFSVFRVFGEYTHSLGEFLENNPDAVGV